MREFDLLNNYPVIKKRYVSKNSRTIKNRIVASYRGKKFYDGKRLTYKNLDIIYNLKGLIKFNRGGERGGVSSGLTLGGTTTPVYS